MPFEIPKSWVWVKIGDIFNHHNGKQLNRMNNVGTMMNYITTSNLYWGYFILDGLKQMPFKDSEIERCQAIKGDLLVCEGGDVGRASIWNYDYPIMLQNHIHKLRSYYNLCTTFYYYVFYHYNHIGIIGGKGIGIQGFSSNALHNTIVPLPPLNEQKRIVAKIEELLPLVDEYSKAQEALDKLNAKLPDDLRKSILQQAIEGKLVPQDPNDEPASELLKRINPKISASCDNPHYENITENVPFEIPDGWCWCTGNQIFLPMKSIAPVGETFKYIDIDSIDNKNHCIKSPKVLLVKNAPSRASRHTRKGDVLFSMVRPYLQNIALVNENDCIASTGFYVCKPAEILHSKYLFYMMCSNYVTDGLNKFMKGDNSPSINKGNIDSYLFPLPPLNEQKRIVAKIEQLFSTLDTITTLLK